MSLSQRTPMRKCGTRYATELGARLSKRGQQPGAVVEQCWVPGCGGWHVRSAQSAARRPLPLPADTGPDRKTREAVYERDGWCCVCCGETVIGRPHSVAHRQRRSQGGSLCKANLVTALGFGTGLVADDHHFRIDSRSNPKDEIRGLTVRSHQNPHLVPVYAPFGRGGDELYLTCDGEWSDVPAEVSA